MQLAVQDARAHLGRTPDIDGVRQVDGDGVSAGAFNDVRMKDSHEPPSLSNGVDPRPR
jgi:hypothetical protein